MKSTLFLLSAISCACILGSCNSESEEVVNNETVNYTFSGFAVEGGSLSELTTRAEATYNLLAVDVKDGVYVQSVSRVQVPQSEALADVTMPLRVGTHKIYIICSTQPWYSFDASSLLVSWNESTAPLGDTWSAVVDVTVNSGDAQTKDVSLSRVVAFVRTKILDAIPSNLTQFRENLVGGSWCFNLVQQTGDVAAQLVRTMTMPTSIIGQSNIGIGIYTFVPSGVSAATNYTLTALDADGETMQAITFNNVPLVVNQYTSYEGNYFGYDTSFTLSLQTDWQEANVIEF